MTISIISLFYFGVNFYHKNKQDLECYEICIYLITNLIGYIIIGFYIIKSSKMGVDYYLRIIDKIK
jgi:hypothetical protein